MVLTNFELWAADGSSALNMPLEFDTTVHTRHLNPFDTRAVPTQLNSNITHMSSNGYYGFSYVNAAHIDIEDSNNNNNNTSTYNIMPNDVNGMNNTTMTATTTISSQTHAVSANNNDSAANAAGHAVNVTRCKKRFFVMNDAEDCAASNKNHNGCDGFAKRCRFDDDFAAQYCNDFFSLPSTQIATQSCLMDTEEVIHTQPEPQPQQQRFPIQQQVDEAMLENNNNNTEKYEQNLHLQLQHQQQEQSQMQTATAQSTPPTQHQQLAAQSPQQQHLYHQQQHYQDTHNSCDTISCNNHRKYKTDTQNSEDLIKSRNLTKINDNVANDLKVDDATLFAQLHGGCWHHFVSTITSNNKDGSKTYFAT